MPVTEAHDTTTRDVSLLLELLEDCGDDIESATAQVVFEISDEKDDDLADLLKTEVMQMLSTAKTMHDAGKSHQEIASSVNAVEPVAQQAVPEVVPQPIPEKLHTNPQHGSIGKIIARGRRRY